MASTDVPQWLTFVSSWSRILVPIVALIGGGITAISGFRKLGHKIGIEPTETTDALSARRISQIVLTNRKEKIETLEKLVAEFQGVGYLVIDEMYPGIQLSPLESTKVLTHPVSAYSINGKIVNPFVGKIRFHCSTLQKKLPNLKNQIKKHEQHYYSEVIGYEVALCVSYFDQENASKHSFVKRDGQIVGDWAYPALVTRVPKEALESEDTATVFFKAQIPGLDPSRLRVEDLRKNYTDRFKVGFDLSSV